MKLTVASLIVSVVLVGQSAAQKDDPCEDKVVNLEMRECYRREQVLVNRQADSLAQGIEAGLRKDAQDVQGLGEINSGLLLKAASSLARSQISWKSYRDQHCNAVRYSWTSGSGAGTAHEACMYQMGKARVEELKSDFPDDSGKP